MKGKQFAELAAFVAVARQQSFSRAASDLGVSTPAISQTIRALEDKLSIRLLNRTTRSVATTEAGQKFLMDLEPFFAGVERAIEGLASFRDEASGTLRLNVERRAALSVLAPILARFVERYPGVNVDVTVDDTNTDIVSGRFDAGIRDGDLVDQDMVAVRLSGSMRLATVAAPRFLDRSEPVSSPMDLRHLCCIRTKAADGNVHRWSFEHGGRHIELAVDGPLIVNDEEFALRAAADGAGVAQVAHELAEPLVRSGAVVELVSDWACVRPGFLLYYSCRRQVPRPLRAFIDLVKEGNAAPREIRAQLLNA
jgi:DNA-binding transcriptional LysR family regulator